MPAESRGGQQSNFWTKKHQYFYDSRILLTYNKIYNIDINK